MGHIEKRKRDRGTGWRARYRDPDNRERSKTFARTADAERLLASVEASIAGGHWVDRTFGRITIAAPRWLTVKSKLRPKTRYEYESLERSRILPFRELRLGEPTEAPRAQLSGRAYIRFFLPEGWADKGRQKAGRFGRSDRFCAELAASSAALCGRSDRSPVRSIAREQHLRPALVDNLIHEAGRRALLTRMQEGRAGGHPIDKARKTLSEGGG